MASEPCTVRVNWHYAVFGWLPGFIVVALVVLFAILFALEHSVLSPILGPIAAVASYGALAVLAHSRVRLVIGPEAVEVTNLLRPTRTLRWRDISQVEAAGTVMFDRSTVYRLRFVEQDGRTIIAAATTDILRASEVDNLLACIKSNAPDGVHIAAARDLLWSVHAKARRRPDVRRWLDEQEQDRR